MDSIRERVMARIVLVLQGNTDAGVNVTRSREVSITRAQAPAIVVMPGSNSLQRLATQVDRNHFTVKVEIFTRGDPWDSLAAAVDKTVHSLLMQDALLAALISDLRRTNEDFESMEADRTAGTLTLTYVATWLASAADISQLA